MGVEPRRRAADRQTVNSRRWFAVGMTIAAVAVGGWKQLIPGLDFASASGNGQAAETQLQAASAFVQASAALETYHATAGSYDGAELSPTSPVKLAWTADASYCLQGGGLYEIGPAGVPQPGACPAG
jgi:hypothetical protein